VKVTPFFLLPIIYKTLSWALLVTLLGYYTFIILLAVLVYQCVIQKKVGFLPQHITRGIFYNLCTIARPAAHSTWNSKMAFMFRLDTYGSLFIHVLCLSIATILWDTLQWDLNVCAFTWLKENLSIIARSVVILGILNGVVAEAYLTFLPHIVLPEMEKAAIEETDKKLGWGAERVTYKTQTAKANQQMNGGGKPDPNGAQENHTLINGDEDCQSTHAGDVPSAKKT